MTTLNTCNKHPLFIEMDKSQAEWVVVAHLAQDPMMLKVIREGLDPHAMTGSLISGWPIKLVIEESKYLGHETDPDKIKIVRQKLAEDLPKICASDIDIIDMYRGFVPRNMSIRQMGKKSNHALNYDMSAQRFAMENETPLKDAKQIVPRYYQSYPGIKQNFHGGVRRQLEENRTLTNCFGRKRRFLDQWSNDLLKQAYDFIPQSTVGDIINKAFAKVYKYEIPRGVLYPATQVHDSILLECFYSSGEQLWEAVKRVEGYMTPTLCYNGMEFTINTDAKAGYKWGEKSMYDLPINDEKLFLEALEKIEATL